MAKKLSKKMTLSEFYESYVYPVCRVAGDADPKTVALDQIALKYWVRFTGDPPMKKITQKTVMKFILGLKDLPGRRGRKMAATTQAARIIHLQFILDRAGPRKRGRRNAAGLFSEEMIEITKPKIAKETEPKILSLDQIAAWMQAAEYARTPRVPGVAPSDWWKALILVAYNTGLRIGTLMGLEWSMLDQNGWLTVPASIYKGGRKGIVSYCNRHARAALETISGTENAKIFPWPRWPTSSRWLQEYRVALWRRAGIEDEGNGFHGLRRAVLSWAAAQNDTAARAIAGHAAGGDILLSHYVDRRALVVDVLERLPQPKLTDDEQEEVVEHRKAA